MGRKQSQSAESVWRDRPARFRKSHLTVAEFCRQESVSDPSGASHAIQRIEAGTDDLRRVLARPERSFDD